MHRTFAFHLPPGTTYVITTAPEVLTVTISSPPATTEVAPLTTRLRTAAAAAELDYPEALAAACAELSLLHNVAPEQRSTARDFLVYSELPLARIDKENTTHSLVVTTYGRLLGCRLGDLAGVYWGAGARVAGSRDEIISLIEQHLLPDDNWSFHATQAFLKAITNLAAQNAPTASGADCKGTWFYVCDKNALIFGEVPVKCVSETDDNYILTTSFGRAIKCNSNNLCRDWAQAATKPPLQNRSDLVVWPFINQ
jgi:hypothetical protein